MAVDDPDIVGLMDAIRDSKFGPMTKDALNDQLRRAAKCNGAPGDDNIRFMLISSVRFSLAEPERFAKAFESHKQECARVSKVEQTLKELGDTVKKDIEEVKNAVKSKNDIEIPLPTLIFGEGRTLRAHGFVSQLVVVALVLIGMMAMITRYEQRHTEELESKLEPIRTVLHIRNSEASTSTEKFQERTHAQN